MRYLDDVFNSSTDVQLFLNVLDNQHLNLCFTCEKASSSSLPFFDVELTICNREFNVSVYRKPAFTGVLLHFNSIAPLSWKQGLITCLLHCAYLYSSSDPLLKTRINFIISLLNGRAAQYLFS